MIVVDGGRDVDAPHLIEVTQAICPMHQMLAPRSTREFINYGK